VFSQKKQVGLSFDFQALRLVPRKGHRLEKQVCATGLAIFPERSETKLRRGYDVYEKTDFEQNVSAGGDSA
jgi:hypothetical protein